MKFIAHRGNVDGVNFEKENTTEYIISTIDKGFDVEIDIWCINDEYYLGHDVPVEKISIDFLLDNSKWLWCHSKDIHTFNELLKYDKINTFFHDSDDCALTSHKYLWTYFGKPLTEKSILLKFDKDDSFIIPKNIYGICSDNIKYYKNNK